MNNKLSLISLFFIVSSYLFCNQTIFEVEKNNLKLNNSQLLQFNSLTNIEDFSLKVTDPQFFVNTQNIKTVSEKYAVATTNFKSLYGISILTESCSGLCAFELELFVEKNAKLTDTLFLYSSNDVHGRDTPFYVDLNKLERGKWVKLPIWMPQYLARAGNGPDLQISNPSRFKFEDINSPLSPRARRAMDGLADLTTTDGIYIHSISLKKSTLNLLNHNEKRTISEALKLYPSHFENEKSIFLLLIFFILFVVVFLLQMKRRLGHKILLGFIVPISLVSFFLINLGINDILSSVETSELYKVQKKLQADIFNINGLGEKIQNSFSQNLEKVIIPQLKDSLKSLREKNIDLNTNLYAKASTKVMYLEQPEQYLTQFKLGTTLDLRINKIVRPHNINIVIANDSTLYFSNHYYLDKGIRHLATMFQKYIKNELKTTPNKNGRQQIEAIRELITSALNSSKTFDQFINNPSLPVRLQKHSIESKVSSNKVFWSYFLEQHQGVNIVWLIFGGVEKQAVQATLEKHLKELYQTGDHSYDEFFFLGDNLLSTISNSDSLDNELLEISSYAKNNQSLTFFPKITDGKLYFYSYHMYEPSMLYSFTLRKSGDDYLKVLQTTKNSIYYSIYLLFLAILICSYLLSMLVTRPMSQLSEGMLRIEQEELQDDLPHNGKDQFSEVSRLLNQVLVSLREKQHLSKFLSNMVLNSLDSEQLSSSRQDQYIMFCGIQNLKELEESIALERVVHFIDLFLQCVQKVIVKYDGRIDKFTGKSSLSIFDSKSDPKDIIQVLLDLKDYLTEFATIHKVKIHFGVGLAKGSVVLGHVGAKQRKDFTAIGSTVNKAARLEALASKTTDQTNVYFDQVCFELFKEYDHFDYQLCESVHLKGYKEEQSVYELL